MKHLFIVNPVAGRTKISEKLTTINNGIGALSEELKNENDFEIYVTQGTMDACRKIKEEAASGKPLRVYACGGDGTLNECVNGAVGLPHVAITHYPCGTGNDFIKIFGEEKKRFLDIETLVTGEIRPIDVIRCNDRYSINICSVGIDARVAADVHKYSKKRLFAGGSAYIASLVENFISGISSRMTAKTENLVCGPELNVVCVCNGRYYGGGFNPTNDARPDDGKLDCLIISGVTRLNFLTSILTYAKGGYRKLPRYITFVRTDHVEVEAKDSTVINIDGEIIHGKNITFDLIPAGVNFIVPGRLEFFEQS